jgi:hypothetical protein
MDNPSMPWSLIGVSDEARKIIRVAAAENNQTIGQWLNDRILRAAAASNSGTDAQPTGPSTEDLAVREILQRMERVLADAEAYSTQEIEFYQVALGELSRRLKIMENTDSKG